MKTLIVLLLAVANTLTSSLAQAESVTADQSMCLPEAAYDTKKLAGHSLTLQSIEQDGYTETVSYVIGESGMVATATYDFSCGRCVLLDSAIARPQ